MKQQTITLKAHTLGDLAERRALGHVTGLYACCNNQSCRRVHVPLDLDAMIERYGAGCDWKRLKPICGECVKANRAYRNATLHVDWSHMAHVRGVHR